MSGFPILDLVGGIIFIYFLLSIISSSAVEMVMTAFKLRGKMLGKWLKEIFNMDITLPDGTKQKLGRAIMDHCSVTALSKAGKAPSYIDAKNFTAAFLEKITYDPANKNSITMDLDSIIDSIKKSDALPHSLQRVLLTYAYEARDKYAAVSKATVTEATSIMSEVDLFKQKIERWFDTNMDRVSGALKIKYIRPLTLSIGIIAVVLLNADSISIAKFLYTNPQARASMAAQAYDAGKDTSFQNKVARIKMGIDTSKESGLSFQQIKDTLNAQMASIKNTKAVLESSGLPLGWTKNDLRDPSTGRYSFKLILSKTTGLFATVLAVMMGAPFWFDVLNKISNMRSAGKKPESSS
ncbi:MAG: hypothetical protein V4557_10920 [Bacteroidota bacterium]